MKFPTAEDLKNRKVVPEACKGCLKREYISGNDFCKLYLDPTQWWIEGNAARYRCPAATHYNPEKNEEHKHLDSIKASKQKMGKHGGLGLRKYVHKRAGSKKKYFDGSSEKKGV